MWASASCGALSTSPARRRARCRGFERPSFFFFDNPVLLSSYARCSQERSFAFSDSVGEVVAAAADEVRPALSAVERAVAQGLHAAGFVCYEAAAGLDPAFTTRPAGALPLVYFGLFEERTPVAAPSAGLGTYEPVSYTHLTLPTKRIV